MTIGETSLSQPNTEPLPAESVSFGATVQQAVGANETVFERPDLEALVTDIARDAPAAAREDILALLILFGA